MSELKRLEQEALRELAEKARREHDVERVVNAARAYKRAWQWEQHKLAPTIWANQINEARNALFEALAVLDGEA